MRKLVVMTLLIAACGGGGGGGSISLDDYPTAGREAFCRYFVRCGAIESLDACMAANIGINIHISASERAAIDMAKINYSGSDVGACLDAIANRSCDVTSESSRVVPDACRRLVAGTRHDGEACALDEECVSLACNVASCDPATCCMGTCAGNAAPAPAKIGESCLSAECAAGAFCDTVSQLCAALKPAGAACNIQEECDYGLGCLGTCRALPTLGQNCTGLCRDVGTACSTASQTCVKLGLAGATCTPSADGTVCTPFYPCDGTGHCSAGIALGQPCGNFDLCAGNTAFCDVPIGQISGMCSLPKPDGSACSRDSACQSAHCDPVTLTCTTDQVCI